MALSQNTAPVAGICLSYCDRPPSFCTVDLNPPSHNKALDYAWEYNEYLQAHLQNNERKLKDLLSRYPAEVDKGIELFDIRDGMFDGAYLSTEMIDGRTSAKTDELELELVETKLKRKIVELRNKEAEVRKVEKDLQEKKKELSRPRVAIFHPPWMQTPHVPTLPFQQMSIEEARKIQMDARDAGARLQTLKQEVATQENKLEATKTALVKANANLSDAVVEFKDLRNMMMNMQITKNTHNSMDKFTHTTNNITINNYGTPPYTPNAVQDPAWDPAAYWAGKKYNPYAQLPNLAPFELSPLPSTTSAAKTAPATPRSISKATTRHARRPMALADRTRGQHTIGTSSTPPSSAQTGVRDHGYLTFSNTCYLENGCKRSGCGFVNPYQVEKCGTGELALLPKYLGKESRKS
ncbi:hypothetical protein E8E11_000968 [Didymella keratinophila]|nr:hypothetical protein E8E11_000968 [Didymella keratinophila]